MCFIFISFPDEKLIILDTCNSIISLRLEMHSFNGGRLKIEFLTSVSVLKL